MNHLRTFGQYGGTKFYGSKGAGILPYCTTTRRMLLGLRGPEANEPGTWGIFGGKFDDHELDKDPKEIALRELYEETEFDGEDDMVLIDAYVFQDKKTGFTYYNFIGLVDEEFKTYLNWENTRTKWFTYQEVEKLPNKHFGLRDLLSNIDPYYPELKS